MWEIEKALDIEFDGERLFDSVQATWNLLEQSAGAALSEAHEAGLGVIIKEGLANGRLTSRNQEPQFLQSLELLQESAKSLGASVDQLALAAVLRQPWVDVVLSGAATEEHISSNSKASELTCENGLLDELKKLVQEPKDYWSARSALRWN